MTTPGSVVVGYCDSGTWSASFGLSYRDLLLHDMATDGRIMRPGGAELRKVAGTMGVAAGRNEIAQRFLDRTDADWLWMVDTDMGFSADTVDRMVMSATLTGATVLGALCFALRADGSAEHYGQRFRVTPTLYSYHELADEVGFRPIIRYPRDSVVQVAGTGAACVLIHRSALEKVRAEYGDSWFDPITHPTGVQGRPRTFSEDLSFCVRLASQGVDVFVDTSIKTSHHKGALFLDEALYDGQEGTPDGDR